MRMLVTTFPNQHNQTSSSCDTCPEMARCSICDKEFCTEALRDKHQHHEICQLTATVRYPRKRTYDEKTIYRDRVDHHFHCLRCDFRTISVPILQEHASQCSDITCIRTTASCHCSYHHSSYEQQQRRCCGSSCRTKPENPSHCNNDNPEQQEGFSKRGQQQLSQSKIIVDFSDRWMLDSLFVQHMFYTIVLLLLLFSFVVFIYVHFSPKCETATTASRRSSSELTGEQNK